MKPTAIVELDEVLALRPGCVYELLDEPPEAGTYWAVRAVPCQFPGDHHPNTAAGDPVEQVVVAVAERRLDNGLWQWCHATWACKKLFGNLLFDNTTPEQRDRWWYIQETRP